jgi:hypothetical protein
LFFLSVFYATVVFSFTVRDFSLHKPIESLHFFPFGTRFLFYFPRRYIPRTGMSVKEARMIASLEKRLVCFMTIVAVCGQREDLRV